MEMYKDAKSGPWINHLHYVSSLSEVNFLSNSSLIENSTRLIITWFCPCLICLLVLDGLALLHISSGRSGKE
jgi:hypothetical protein